MTSDQKSTYDCFAERRASKRLPKGMRYLTPDDIWQKGDQYDGAGNGDPWWAIGSKHTSVKPGSSVDVGWLCYTPRGSVERENV